MKCFLIDCHDRVFKNELYIFCLHNAHHGTCLFDLIKTGICILNMLLAIKYEIIKIIYIFKKGNIQAVALILIKLICTH